MLKHKVNKTTKIIFIVMEMLTTKKTIFSFSPLVAIGWYEKWTQDEKRKTKEKNWIFKTNFFPFFFLSLKTYQNICFLMWLSSYLYLFTWSLIALCSHKHVRMNDQTLSTFSNKSDAIRRGTWTYKWCVQSWKKLSACVPYVCLVGHWTTISIGLLLWLGWMDRVYVCVCVPKTMFAMSKSIWWISSAR